MKEIKVFVGGELIYYDIERIFKDLSLIDNKIEVRVYDDTDMLVEYRVKEGTKNKIGALFTEDAQLRLAKICMAIDYNVSFELFVDGELICKSIQGLVNLLSNLKLDVQGNCDYSYYKDLIIINANNDLLFSIAIENYRKATLIMSLIKEYNASLSEG